MLRKLFRNKKGQGLVEYALIIAGVALIAAVGISIFGHKVSDMIAATATVLPGAHPDDNAPISSGKLIETTAGADSALELDVTAIAGAADTPRLGNNVLGVNGGGTNGPDGFGGLVLEVD